MKSQIIGVVVILLGASVIHNLGWLDIEGVAILLAMALPAWVIANAG